MRNEQNHPSEQIEEIRAELPLTLGYVYTVILTRRSISAAAQHLVDKGAGKSKKTYANEIENFIRLAFKKVHGNFPEHGKTLAGFKATFPTVESVEVHFGNRANFFDNILKEGRSKPSDLSIQALCIAYNKLFSNNLSNVSMHLFACELHVVEKTLKKYLNAMNAILQTTHPCEDNGRQISDIYELFGMDEEKVKRHFGTDYENSVGMYLVKNQAFKAHDVNLRAIESTSSMQVVQASDDLPSQTETAHVAQTSEDHTFASLENQLINYNVIEPSCFEERESLFPLQEFTLLPPTPLNSQMPLSAPSQERKRRHYDPDSNFFRQTTQRPVDHAPIDEEDMMQKKQKHQQ